MLLINSKIELSLTWHPNFVLSNLVGTSAFTATDAKLSQLLPCQQKTMQNYQNVRAKTLKDQPIGTNKK